MLQTFVITLREGVEAALVIAIAMATLRKSGRADLLPAVYRGLAAAVVACLVGAWAFSALGISSDSYEGYTLLVSAAFVFSMVIWMNRHGRTMKQEIEGKLGSGLGAWGVFLFVFLMIFREGVETVLLLAAVQLNTSGLLEGLGALLGIGLAVLFGVSFVRGTIRVNLRQFFQMTTVILMVVVVQLAVSGLHELSESQVLPSSPAEMAVIGPVVKNEVFFFVTILALAGAMMLWEWRKRKAPGTTGLEGAALRKVLSTERREKVWMVASCAASSLFILLITAEFIYARQSTGLSPAMTVAVEGGVVRIPVASVQGGELHRFEVASGGIHLRFIAIEKADHSIATALDACQICGAKGFYQKGPEIVCRHCASSIVAGTIGTKGGCNPIPLASHIEGGTLVVDAKALEPAVAVFRGES